MRFDEYHPGEIPAKPGVYMFRDRFGKVIYVGKARDLRRRLGNYFQPSRRRTGDAKLRSLINSIAEWSFQVVRTEDEALLLESQLIKSYAPYYNILMRDDKRYLLLKINMAEPFPTIQLARLRKPDGACYYGPFPHGNALKNTREFLLAHFGLRGCRDSYPDAETRKHCLKRLIKDCCAPCTGQVSAEEYRQKLQGAISVLDGDIKPVLEAVKQQMAAAAAKQNFEQAARLRDVMNNISAVFGRKNRVFENAVLPDRRLAPGEGSMRALAERLHLKNLPHNIICFDNSNILGTFAVSSMVTFTDGKPNRNAYKRFKVKTVTQSDDYATMREVVGRHLKSLLTDNKVLPDLMVIDGGKGQLSSALDAMIDVRCPAFPVISLAERNEEIFIPGRAEPLVLDRHDLALRLLQALRDEAHRFAITYHRTLRLRRIDASLLDDIPGVGPVRKRELLRNFGSLRALAAADPETIAVKTPGLGMAMAEKIYEALSGFRKQKR